MIRRILSVVESTLQAPAVIQQYSMKNDLNWLSNITPCFCLDANNIRILTDPNQFYQSILHYCATSKRRITLVSLYLGNGELEKQIVNVLKENKYFQSRKLNLNVLLDYTRGSRDTINSRTILLPLLQCNESNCTVSLYHTPALRGLLKKFMPSRWNEIIGLQHMKLYIFDDTLIISGANLSNDYFTNRQDRYFVIQDKQLTDFYNQLVHKVQSFSFKIDKNNHLSLANNWFGSPYEGNKNKFIERASDCIKQYLKKARNKHRFKDENQDTWIFPTVQMGQLGITQDAQVTEKILTDAAEGANLKIATGYFNLTSTYMDTLIHSTKSQCEILMAHPSANGFLGAKGAAGGIPYAYSLIARKFKKQYEKNGQNFRIKLLEYLRTGWTYHAKGLWFYPPKESYPTMTLIGSPNFGDRSVKKDLETQLVIVTKNQKLRKDMHNEYQRLYEQSQAAVTERWVPLWVHIFVMLFRNYF